MEFSGLDPRKHSIVSIGAVDFENPSRQFYKECRIWHGAEIVPESLAICGFSEDEVKNPRKNTELVTTINFLEWMLPLDDRTFAGHNVFADRDFLIARQVVLAS